MGKLFTKLVHARDRDVPDKEAHQRKRYEWEYEDDSHDFSLKACEDCGLNTSVCLCGVGHPRIRMPEMIENDPWLLSRYTTALNSGKEEDRSLRVNVVGNFRQGKTTLVKRIVEKDVENVESTNGIDVDTYICKRNISGNTQNKTGCTESRHVSGSNTSTNIFKTVQVSAISRSEENRQTKVAITFWDFGGQYVFYATHTLFHSNRAVYILVFDLSIDLEAVVRDEEYPDDTRANKNMEYFARFWMSSIHSFVGSEEGTQPPVIIVGTHMDKLHGSPKEKRRKADRYFERIRGLFDDSDIKYHFLPADFAIDNTDPSDNETKYLRDELFHIASSRAEIYDIPARWISLAEALKKIQHLKIVSFESIVIIDRKNALPLKDKMQIKLFLQYHHAKGTLVYFDEDPLSSFVVLDVQYLIDAFKCIITSERFCSRDAAIRPLWIKLKKEGRLEMELLDKLWGNASVQNFLAHKEVLLAYLKKHNILSEVLQFDEHTGQSKGMGWFVVPSLLNCCYNQVDLQQFLEGKTQTEVRLVIKFDFSSVIHTVYHRLLAAALGRWPVAHIACRSLLYENLGVFLLREDHAGIVEINGDNIDLRVANLCVSASVDNTVADQFRRFADFFIECEFRKLRDHGGNDKTETARPIRGATIPETNSKSLGPSKSSKPLICAYRCNHKSHGLDGSYKTVLLEQWEGKKLMPCPDLLSHEIDVEVAKCEWFQEDGVTENVPEKTVDDKQLSKIAQAIGRNWEILGFELGLTRVQIYHIHSDNHSSVMKIFAMLQMWQDQLKENATISALVKALKRCKTVDVDWDKIRNFIEELK